MKAKATVDSQNYRLTLYIVGWFIKFVCFIPLLSVKTMHIMKYFVANPQNAKRQAIKFTSVKFHSVFDPGYWYCIMRIQRLESKQCRST